MPSILSDSSHTEPGLTVFLRSEGERGLLDGDPREEEIAEATNDDNSVVTLHPDILELLQLSHSTQILSRSQRSQIRARPTARLNDAAHPSPPRTRGATSASLEASPPRPQAARPISASLEGRRPTLGE